MDMYAKCRMLSKAQEVFVELLVQDIALWNTLIAGYGQCGYNEEAVNYFMQMQDEGLSPDEISYVHVLKACGSIVCLKMGEEMHTEIAKQRLLENNIILSTAVVDMYAKYALL